jgi:hypothetical protein
LGDFMNLRSTRMGVLYVFSVYKNSCLGHSLHNAPKYNHNFHDIFQYAPFWFEKYLQRHGITLYI